MFTRHCARKTLLGNLVPVRHLALNTLSRSAIGTPKLTESPSPGPSTLEVETTGG